MSRSREDSEELIHFPPKKYGCDAQDFLHADYRVELYRYRDQADDSLFGWSTGIR
jgi:hypothetical protein